MKARYFVTGLFVGVLISSILMMTVNRELQVKKITMEEIKQQCLVR